jgi:hypothetical protein
MLRILLFSALLCLSPSLVSSAAAGRAKPYLKATGHRAVQPNVVRHRSHLTGRILSRLHPRAQQNAHATIPVVVAKAGKDNQVVLGHGTGFFVTRPDANGRAMIMTNHHVMEHAVGQFAAVNAGGVSLQAQTRVVLTSKRLDYALLEVALPPQVNITPVTLAKASRRRSEVVYSVGYPSTQLLGEKNFAGSARAWKKATASEPVGKGANALMAAAGALARSPQIIALGKDDRSTVAAAKREKHTDYFDVPGAPGASGSAVFSRSSHNVVGLLYGATPRKDGKTMASAVTPMSLILKDVRHRVTALQANDRTQVQRMLEGR